MKISLLAGVVVAGWVGAAQADTITQPLTFASFTGYTTENAPSLNYFDPALGTLTGVTINANITAQFTGGAASDANEIDYRLTVGGVTTVGALRVTGNASGSIDLGSSSTLGVPFFARAGSFVPSITSFNGGGTSAAVTTTFAMTNSVIYTYTPFVTSVPEPASLALLGIGLAGIAGVRRRRAG